MPAFYGELMLALCPPLVCSLRLLFNVFADAFHIWKSSSLSATWGTTMSWWRGSYWTWLL